MCHLEYGHYLLRITPFRPLFLVQMHYIFVMLYSQIFLCQYIRCGYIRIWIIFSRFILLKAGAISHYSQENGIERSNVTANPYQRYSNWCYILFNITQRSSFKKSQTYVNIIAKQNIYINNLTHPFVLSWFKRQSLCSIYL